MYPNATLVTWLKQKLQLLQAKKQEKNFLVFLSPFGTSAHSLTSAKNNSNHHPLHIKPILGSIKHLFQIMLFLVLPFFISNTLKHVSKSTQNKHLYKPNYCIFHNPLTKRLYGLSPNQFQKSLQP